MYLHSKLGICYVHWVHTQYSTVQITGSHHAVFSHAPADLYPPVISIPSFQPPILQEEGADVSGRKCWVGGIKEGGGEGSLVVVNNQR